jgi:hypothetical protein
VIGGTKQALKRIAPQYRSPGKITLLLKPFVAYGLQN